MTRKEITTFKVFRKIFQYLSIHEGGQEKIQESYGLFSQIGLILDPLPLPTTTTKFFHFLYIFHTKPFRLKSLKS